MHEITFNDIVKQLEEEISSIQDNLAKDKDASELLRVLCAKVLEDRRDLLEKLRSAIRNERDRLQSARDHIDATLYSLMAAKTKEPYFDDNFKGELEQFYKLKRELNQDFDRHPKGKKEFSFPSQEDCEAMADRLNNLELKMNSEPCVDSTAKLIRINRMETLRCAARILRAVAKKL